MNINYYNNLGIGIISISAVLNRCKELPLSKLCLALPFFSHRETLLYLSRETTQIKSIEKLIADKTSYFSNFNKRYYDSLCLTFNAIQYLHEVGNIYIKANKIVLIKTLEYENQMGTRANRIFKASKNIAILLNENTSKLYLNLRVVL
jgi:hypothetical protein